MEKIVIVTGDSSGIGKSVCEALVSKGCKVYGISRREFTPNGYTHLRGDVSDEKNIEGVIQEILDKEKKIDILVNCAGYGISGAVEFTSIEDAKKQFDVNFFGMVNVNKVVLKVMREQKMGRIVTISSLAALTPIPFQTYYSASKAAINTYTMAVANEVKPFNISMTAIQPGDIATAFTDVRCKEMAGDKEYGGRITKGVAVMEHDERNGMSADEAGKYIAKIALKKKVKPLYAIGFQYKFIAFLVKIFPCGFANKIIGSLYAK